MSRRFNLLQHYYIFLQIMQVLSDIQIFFYCISILYLCMLLLLPHLGLECFFIESNWFCFALFLQFIQLVLNSNFSIIVLTIIVGWNHPQIVTVLIWPSKSLFYLFIYLFSQRHGNHITIQAGRNLWGHVVQPTNQTRSPKAGCTGRSIPGCIFSISKHGDSTAFLRHFFQCLLYLIVRLLYCNNFIHSLNVYIFH